jgi:hypothetical protein
MVICLTIKGGKIILKPKLTQKLFLKLIKHFVFCILTWNAYFRRLNFVNDLNFYCHQMAITFENTDCMKSFLFHFFHGNRKSNFRIMKLKSNQSTTKLYCRHVSKFNTFLLQSSTLYAITKLTNSNAQ